MLEHFKHYPNLKYVKLIGKTKKPFEEDWQNKPYTFDEIKKYHEEGKNYGVLTGHGDLIVIDCDKVTSSKDRNKRYPELDEELSKYIEKLLPDTLTVRSGSGAKHFYYICKGISKKIILKSKYKNDSVHWGEILSKGNQAVGPGSYHPETGNIYEIINDKPIAQVNPVELFKTLNAFIPFLNEEEEKPKNISAYSSIDDLNVLDIFGTSGLKLHNGEYSGPHPIHGSSTGMNFWINPSKNTWNCFRCQSGGGPAKAIAVKHGIIQCDERLYGDKFNQVLKIARKEYGLKDLDKKKKEIIKSKLKTEDVLPKRKLEPLNFSEFMSQVDNKVYYVKNMFGSGTINMIFSPPKQMKSFVSYYLALCMAQGKSFLNLKTKKINVCYFDWENPIGDIQNRVKGICKGMNFDVENLDNFYFFPKQPTFMRVDRYDSFVYEDLKNQLTEFVEKNDIKVLFFDTFRRLGNFDENDSRTINTIKSDLFDPLIQKTNVCIIFLHHTSKEGATYRGSVDIEGILDTAFKITKKELNDTIKITLTCTARRNNEIDKITSNVNIETNSLEDEDGDMYEIIESVEFNRTTEESDEVESDYSSYRDYFINNLELGEEYRNKDLVEMIRYNFNITASATQNKIINWLTYQVSPKVLLKSGKMKSTRYQINPELKENFETIDITSKGSLAQIEEYMHKLFAEIDQIKISQLVLDKKKGWNGLFSMENVSVIIDKWNKKGWINTAKKDYLTITDIYRGEQE
jgi:hypothetical protein